MNPQLEPIALLLKKAREKKGFSQRVLGEKVGLPQSHVSKIERAEVDLQTTSLIEIARALDLEVALLPRTAIAAIKAFQDERMHDTEGASLPAYRLDEGEDDV